MARYRGLARETGLWLSLGGFQETGPDAGHTHNTHVVLDAGGNTVAAYRKARSPSWSDTACSLLANCMRARQR